MQEPMFTPQLKGPVAACITRALNRKIRDECKFSVHIKCNDSLFYLLLIYFSFRPSALKDFESYLKTKFTVRLSKNNAGKENLTGDRNRLNTTKKKV